MKNIYKFLIAVILFGFASADLLHAQQEVTIRDLNTYTQVPSSQAVLPDHPLVGEEVVFDAVIMSYPRNSGLANITDAGQPGRIHVFLMDVNAAEEGLDGMFMQIVDPGATRDVIETLFPGEVIRVTGEHTFFNNTVQLDPTDVEILGNVNDPEYADLEPLMEPTTIALSELNMPSPQDGLHRWNPENYTKYINRYVRIEGLEVLTREIDDTGRPWYILTDGNTILTSNDTSLRFRNDRDNYAFDPETGEGLGYNYRRIADGGPDGPFVPPAPGSIVDISGYVVVNTFNPAALDESGPQSTLKIVPWDDGVVWQNDGDDPNDRLTPPGWPNDLIVQGFAPILTEFEVTPGEDESVFNDTEVSLSIDVLLPEVDYTLVSVEVEYEVIPYTDDEGDLITESMTAAGGDTYEFTFETQNDFTTVNYTIIATAETPEGVQTFGRQSGTFFVESETQTSPAVFSPGAGTYLNQVEVTLTSATEGATIYYTTDGETPDENSLEYISPLSFTESTTLTTIAIADGLDDSPVNARSYQIDIDVTEVSTIAELRAGLQDGTLYQFTGDAVVTYTRTNRNQKYIQDDTAGILIDDPGTPNIPDSYVIGTVLTDVVGSLTTFQGTLQFTPAFNPGEPQATTDVDPPSLTLAELGPEHMSMLVRIEDVSFVDSGEFASAQNYSLVDGSVEPEDAVTFRTSFTESDYLGEPIPEGVINLVGLVSIFNNQPQLTARSLADFEEPTSTDHSANPYKFSLSQNFPNPFNPSTQINYSLAETADVRLVVYDILGRRVATLVNEVQNAGIHSINFDMSRYASGTYIYRLEAGDFVSVKKMMLIK